MTLSITLPLPDRRLSPNARVHFMAKAKLTKASRTSAMVACLAMMQGGWKPRWKSATVRIQWFAKTKMFPDAQNASASLKAHIDGLQDAGLIESDRYLTWYPIEFAVDKANPRLVLHVIHIQSNGHE